MDTRFKNTDFFIEDIDESVKDLTVNDTSVSHFPAITDFFIENIDNNVIEICTDRGITPSTVSVVPANTDFFIINIDTNVKKIATDLSITPSSVSKTPANTDFFIENIYFNLILICEELNIEPYEISVSPTNTDFFIEAIAENVEKIMEAQTEIHVSGTFIHAVLSVDSKISDYELDGNATQTTYSGKNLIDGANPTDANLATSSFSNDIITVSSTTTATTPYVRWVIEGLSLNDVIRYSAVIQDNNGQVVLQYDNNGSWATITASVRQYTDGTTPATYSWTNTVNTTKVRFLLYANKSIPTGNSSSRYKNAILTLNNSDLSYEPYVGGTASPNPDYPQAIETVTGEQVVKVCGKNLCNDIVMAGGSILLFTFDKYIIQAGTYTLSTTLNADVSYNTVSLVLDGNSAGNLGTVTGTAGTTITCTFTLTEVQIASIRQATTAQIRIYKSGAGFTVPEWGQIELGNSASSFEPYQGQSQTIDLDTIELAKIGTYQDKIYLDNGKWYLHKEVGKVIFDGSEGWSIYGTGTANYYYRLNSAVSNQNYTGRAGTFISNYSEWGDVGNTTTASGIFITSIGQLRLRYGTEMAIADWKAKLTATPMVLYYQLATPTDTEITNSALLTQLNAIYDIELKEGIVNISITATSPNLPASLKATIIPKE